MKLNEHQRKFAYPLFLLISILGYSMVRHGLSLERAGRACKNNCVTAFL